MNNIIITFSLTLFQKTTSKISKLPTLLLFISLFCVVAKAQYNGSEIIPLPRTSTYVFKYGQSTIVKTGGFAGVREIYHIQGTFQLSVDFDSMTALFSRVDANLLDESGLLYQQSLGEILNMTELIGTVVNDRKIEFVGQTSDGLESAIRLTLILTSDNVQLTGKTIPPVNSADFFIYELQSTALRKYGGGTGKSNDPYLIYTPEQINSIGVEPNDWDKHFKLMDNIDLGGFFGADFNVIGKSTVPFTGIFDGNGLTISNLEIIGGGFLGLFGHLADGAQVRHLGLVGIKIIGSDEYVGGLVGRNSGTVAYCYSTGIVRGVTDVGVLVGNNRDGIVNQCYSAGFAGGNYDVGGLVGDNSYGTVSNCYSNAAVTATEPEAEIQFFAGVGGLIGSNYSGQVDRCYSAGAVGCGDWKNSHGGCGGLIGNDIYCTSALADCSVRSVVTMCFWDTHTSGRKISAGGIGKTTNEMKTMCTFTENGWDFADEIINGTEDIWSICEGTNYPRLTWQIPAGDFVCPEGVRTEDFLFFIEHWRDDNCNSGNGYCQGTDLDKSGTVDMADLEIFIENWLVNNTPVNSDSVVENNVEYYIQTNKNAYDRRETVEILYRVTNLSSEPVDLGYTVLGMFFCRFNITDEDGNDVWKWPWITPLGPSMKFTLRPFEPQEFRINWNMINDNGTMGQDDDFSAGPGIYNIVGTLDMEPKEKRIPVSISVAIRNSDG